jgi:hypothetical protein
MRESHIQFLKDHAETPEGQEWIKFLSEFIEMLYNMKGVPLQEVQARQIAAEHLEKIILRSQDREPTKRAGTEYR